MKYNFEPMDKLRAEEIAKWKYNAPYEFYNIEESQIPGYLDGLTNPANRYFTVYSEESELIGYCAFGPDGQVPGGDYKIAACDVSVGLKPGLTGKGNGKNFFQAVLDFAINEHGPQIFRLTVAKFNSRATRLYEHAGFKKVSEFYNDFKKIEFIVMIK